MSKLATYRARWQAQWASAQHFWQRSSARDRRILRIAAVLVPLLVLWYGFIEPPLRHIDHWQAELPRLRSQLSALETVLADVEGPPPAVLTGDPRTVLEQHLDAAGLRGHYRLTSGDGNGDGEAAAGTWQLTVEDAPAEALMNWLLDDAPRLRLTVRGAQLQRVATRSEAPALISGVVSMEQAPGAKDSS